MTTHRNALDIGTRIDRYEIEAVIGHGGFGISYRAVDVGTGERVALKEFLPTELATREADDSVYPLSESHLDDFQWGLERFLDEVNLLAHFRHPSIVRVHRAFEGNGTAYMVMAYEEGESLAARLKREGTLDATELTAIVMPLLEGLEIVHEAGFIHRDIKPSNIYLRDGGAPVLLDFGSARQALRGKTRTLTALVSAGYAPLEQYFSRSDLQGPWSDIYGLGATLYEAISGAAPVDAVERSRGVLGSTRDILPPAAEVAARDYPSCILAAIDHALRMEDRDRPRSIAEWRRELTGEAPVPECPPTTLAKAETRTPTAHERRPAGAVRNQPGLFGLVALVFLATASLMWWQWSGVSDAIGDRIAEPRPRTAADGPNSQLATLRELLAEANTSAQSAREQIAALTTRLSQLEAARDTERGDDAARRSASEGEQDTVIAELRRALEAANRDGAEARRQADELATRLKLLEAIRTTGNTDLADRRKEIDDLLAAADDDLRRLRLTTPAGTNAHERYRRVLALEADNADARLGLERIAEKYIELAALARDRDDAPGAMRFLDRALDVLPGHAGALSARAELAEAEHEQKLVNDESVEPEPVRVTARLEAPPAPDPKSATARSSPAGKPLRTAHPSSGPTEVAIFPFVRRRFSEKPFHTIVSRRLTYEIRKDPRFRVAYSFYSNPDSKNFDYFPGLWVGGPVTYRLDEPKAMTFAHELDVDVVVTAQMPIGHLGQWSFDIDVQEEIVEIFVLDVRRETLHRVKSKIRVAGESLSRLLARAGLAGNASGVTASSAGAVESESTLAPLATSEPFSSMSTSTATVVAGLSSGTEASAPDSLQSISDPTTVAIDARAAGGFGAKFGIVDDRGRELVEAHVFTRPETVTIGVTGKIDLHPHRRQALGIGPRGISNPRGSSGCHLPLEEGAVDSHGFESLGLIMKNVGAVFGAFVPATVTSLRGFRPLDDDISFEGISSDSLFLVGEGLEFTATEPGTFYVGVNDCLPGNNSGSFTARVSRQR
jgi:serine/threonine protein kinase